MGQVTIYLEENVECKMIEAAKLSHLSKSKWIAKLIQEKVANEWPKSIADIAGAWTDFPELEDIRANSVEDSERESF